MDGFITVVLSIAAYCIVDRWCLHRERIKKAENEQEQGSEYGSEDD